MFGGNPGLADVKKEEVVGQILKKVVLGLLKNNRSRRGKSAFDSSPLDEFGGYLAV